MGGGLFKQTQTGVLTNGLETGVAGGAKASGSVVRQPWFQIFPVTNKWYDYFGQIT